MNRNEQEIEGLRARWTLHRSLGDTIQAALELDRYLMAVTATDSVLTPPHRSHIRHLAGSQLQLLAALAEESGGGA